ncbi:hypothetical protein B484DRAFT_407527 [Ochromonadaceae sp. CCMP2298]|nr:hypothetical protein B484DRAFT_407527 [Ochromonadaceae sp. CCMP2298]
MLCAFLGSPVFADEAKCSSIISSYLTVQEFSTYCYTEVDEKTKEVLDKEIEYYIIDPYQAVINQLKTLRDSFQQEAMRITLGSLGQCIAVCLQCDHDGGSMKFLALLLARVKDTQTMVIDLGRFEGKECYEILKNTVMPSVDRGFAELGAHLIAVVEWEGGFDFVAVPKSKREQIKEESYIRMADGGLRLMWDDGFADFETDKALWSKERASVKKHNVKLHALMKTSEMSSRGRYQQEKASRQLQW